MRGLLLLALTACGRIAFDPLTGDIVPPGDGGNGTGDGSTMGSNNDGSMGATCPAVGCAFPGGLPCSCWGSPTFSNAGLSESNGTLTITPNANTASAIGGCTRTGNTFDSAGAIVEVSQVTTGAQSYVRFDVGVGADIYRIAVSNGQMQMTDGSNMSQVSYDSVQMRWWRIRPTGGNVIFETSPTGQIGSWQTVYSVGRAPSSTYSITIAAGTFGSDPAPGQARIESINLCP